MSRFKGSKFTRCVNRFDFLEPYFDKDLIRRYKQRGRNHVPIPKNLQWKALILVMRDAGWVTKAYIMKETGFKRKRVRCLVKQGLEAGVLEEDVEKYKSLKVYNRFGDRYSTGSPLPRKVCFYRLDMSKLNIEISDD